MAMEDVAPALDSHVVLVAEDETLIRMMAVYALADAGFIVLEAGDAACALDLLRSDAAGIHALFTDVRMPGEMDGVMLAHETQRSWPWIHLVVTSATPIPIDAGLPAQSRFFPKPYDVDVVVGHLHQRLRPDQDTP